MATMTDQRRPGRPRFSGLRQQFSLSHDADNSLSQLADDLGKSHAQVKREILEACKGLDASKYYIALGKLQELANK